MRCLRVAASIVIALLVMFVPASAERPSEGLTYYDTVVLPDIDGDGTNETLAVTSADKRFRGDNSWVQNYLRNCGKPYWNSFVILKGGSDQTETLLNTPIFWCDERPINEVGIFADGRLYMKSKDYHIFNNYRFSEEQRAFIAEKNGWSRRN
jgi:hypothetical protein